ncbi:hypothetical protein LCGC14_2531630 [marine sediment metagenome]|uniref:DUF1565 domain-containing protein n=1 Tax=marine sediment metagenome TaxID=412755 RepID=A0A0F9ATT9_9ZZZZ
MGYTDFPNGITSFGVRVFGGGGMGVTAFRRVYFVDKHQNNPSDGNTGLSIDRPLATVQRALDLVGDEDTIIVMMGDYDEQLTTGLNIGSISAVAPGTAAAGRGRNVNLIGASPGTYPYNSPQLYNVSGSTVTLEMRSPGWRVSGFRIVGDTGSPLCMRVNMAQAASTADTLWSPGTQIDHCVFYGAVGNCSGLDHRDSPPDIRVLNNIFELFQNGLSCITQSNSSFARGYRNTCSYNQFIDSDKYINLAPGGFASSHFIGNSFDSGHVNTVTTFLDNTGGSNCTIALNYFPDTYNIASGYVAGTADNWNGNFGSGGVTAAVPA